MQTAKQLSVSLVNKPGRLAAILDALAKEKIGSRAFCVMDSGSRGTLRFVPEDPAVARSALETIGVDYEETDVLLVEVPSQSGGFQKICRRLAQEHLNVDYAYGSLTSPMGVKGGMLAVVRVNDLAKGQRVLSDSILANGSRPKKLPGRRPRYAR